MTEPTIDRFPAAPNPAMRPVVGVSACRKMLDPHPFHGVGEKYLTAISAAAQALPIMLPALGAQLPAQQVGDLCDGLLFTGSPSNVEPWRYGDQPDDAQMYIDPHRDASTLVLIRYAVAHGIPVLGICRGFQEMNVAFGGTLHRRLHETPGYADHREPKEQRLEVQYGPAHAVCLTRGGYLSTLFNADEVDVNSLHEQGVRTLGADLEAEAHGPDGLVEALRVRDAPAFAVAVQWHPEWRAQTNVHSLSLFKAFGDACRKRSAARRSQLQGNAEVETRVATPGTVV